MAAAQRTKASDKQGISKKLVTLLKKRYKGAVPKKDRSILEIMLYAICLENASDSEAEAAYERLHSAFYDLNEIRVSSVSELAPVFEGMDDPERRAMQIRSLLHHVFERHFAFDLEMLRRKTLDLASRQLDKMRDLSPFVRAYTLQEALGSHVVPIDDRMCHAAVWLGLAEPGAKPEAVSAQLKPVVRKPEAPLFCHLLRGLATDPEFKETFDPGANPPPEEGYDLRSAPERLTDLFHQADHPSRKTAAKKGSARKTPPRKKKKGKSGASKSSGNHSASKSTTAKRSAKKSSDAKRNSGPKKSKTASSG